MTRRTARRSVCGVFLLLGLSTSTQGLGTLLSADEIDSLLGPRNSFARAEVAELVAGLVLIADEEISRTAEEAVKEAVVELQPKVSYYRSLAEGWEAEAKRFERGTTVAKGLAIAEAVIIVALGLYVGVREVVR